MAIYNFAKRISEGLPITVHGHGKMVRDFVWGDALPMPSSWRRRTPLLATWTRQAP